MPRRSGWVLFSLYPYVLAVLLTYAIASPLLAIERSSQQRTASQPDTVQRLLVKWKNTARSQALRTGSGPTIQAEQTARAKALSLRTGISIHYALQVTPHIQLMRFAQPLGATALEEALQRLRNDPEVEYVEPDRKAHIQSLPNDPLFAGQWYLQTTQAAAIRATGAWEVVRSSANTIVAVLDTGVRFEHPDLGAHAQGGKLLPGYDFVHEDSPGIFSTANDGNGRDADPSDPGDWISAQEAANGTFAGCTPSDSSWHGTEVAGIIGAQTNNSVGIAGIGGNSRILPVRVLGKCGGYNSDILAGMRWAAGLSVSGVPHNPYPAHILNLSLGSDNSCSSSYQEVIDEVTAKGVLVVVSAGNASGPVNEPASCQGVLAVGGLRHTGTKVGYSSLGPEIKISAPAGNCVNESGACLFPIDTTSNNGSTVPGDSIYTNGTIRPTFGTSFSAPQAAGVAALMHGANVHLSAAGMIGRMQAAALPFPSEPTLPTCPALDAETSQCNCTNVTCGAGMLNALGAVAQSVRPIASIAVPPGLTSGETVNLNANESKAACNRNITAYRWDILSGSGTFSSASDAAHTTITAPTTGTLLIQLTVTDDQGLSDTETLSISSSGFSFPAAKEIAMGAVCPASDGPPPQTPTPIAEETSPPSSSSSGGGGAMNIFELICLFAVYLMVLRRYRAMRNA